MAGWLNALKDTALSATLRQQIAARVEPYGKVTSCEIDTAAREISLSIMLDGEPDAVGLTVRGYQILEKSGSASLHLPAGAFAASRPWLSRFLNTEIAGKTFPISAKYIAYARTLAG